MSILYSRHGECCEEYAANDIFVVENQKEPLLESSFHDLRTETDHTTRYRSIRNIDRIEHIDPSLTR